MGFFDIFKRKKKQEETTEIVSVVEETAPTVVESQQTGLAILLEQLPTTYGLDETSLVDFKGWEVKFSPVSVFENKKTT